MTETKRKYVFNAGPAALPLEVLQQAQQEFVDFQGQGISLLEMSHRSKTVEGIVLETEAMMLDLMGLSKDYRVLFMGGGASTQFALIPMNFLQQGKTAQYIVSGSFSEKAYQEAAAQGQAHVAANTKDVKWSRLPAVDGLSFTEDTAYVHVTTNNTIEGTQYQTMPTTGYPLIGDMTSEILCRRMDYSQFDMVYAGAQKNLGPAGVTVAVIHNDFLATANKHIPTIFQYAAFAKNDSLYNTPPVHAIYMTNLMLHWMNEQGGIDAIEQRNRYKADLLYKVIDESGGFYQGIAAPQDRSIMNVTWKMQDETLEKTFLQQSKELGFEGLSGHRSVGGMRASAYNAVPVEACRALADFMLDFQKRNG